MESLACPICGSGNPPHAVACGACGAPLAGAALPAHTLPPGTKLAGGAFTVGKVLGQGGFGITYLGSDTRRSRPVAVKELFPAGAVRHGKAVRPTGDWTAADFTAAKQAFCEEGRTLEQFHHPGIVDVFGVFEENDTAYMVMEYLRGQDLEGLLSKRGGPLSEAEAIRHVRAVGEALIVVHGAGLLHRDVKPDNIIDTEDGRTVLIDFGSARAFAAGKTHRMTAMVTPGYAPLEQYSQHARFGPFTDVYGLAATLYHLLTDQIPVSPLDRIQGVELAPVRRFNPAVSERTSRAVAHGMEMEVGKRPQSVQEFLSRLGAVSQPQPGAATRPRASPPRRPPPAPRSPGRPAPLLQPPVQAVTLTGHTRWVNSITFSPNGTLLASGGQDNVVICWDVTGGRARHVLRGHSGPMLGTLGAVFSVSFAPHGNTVASGGNDDTIRLWDANTGRLFRTLVNQGGNVNAVAFSPNDQLLAAGSQSGQVELWNPGRERLLLFLTGHLLSVVALQFSPDGETLASGSEDGTTILWNARTGDGLVRLGEHRGGVRSVAFSPDGRWLATGSDDYAVNVWNLERGTVQHRLAEHRAGVRAVAFSADSRFLATGGDDLETHLWDAARGEPLFRLTGHAGSVTSLAFSPDGSLLATGSMDGTIQLWRLR
jgi:serine/threonine protein kinase